ncbi:hypothetical protein ACLOJK_034267, partial [Asimina triloba]
MEVWQGNNLSPQQQSSRVQQAADQVHNFSMKQGGDGQQLQMLKFQTTSSRIPPGNKEPAAAQYAYKRSTTTKAQQHQTAAEKFKSVAEGFESKGGSS